MNTSPSPNPSSSLDIFVRASANILEFSVFTLQGTGVAKTLQTFISDMYGLTLYEPWILRLYKLPTDPSAKRAEVEALLADPCYGPMTQNLLMTWYTGSWYPLPQSWHANYQTAQADVEQVISAQTYQEGLMWPVFGAHPQGAKQQGWDAWSRPPQLPILS